jgi:hypothetical protein
MRHKVAELEGALLDAAVALAEGWRRGSHGLDGFRPDGQGWLRPARTDVGGGRTEATEVWQLEPNPWSASWAHGGHVIERERITLAVVPAGPDALEWMAVLNYSGATERTRSFDASPLIAAMRAYVASKFGEEVELP